MLCLDSLSVSGRIYPMSKSCPDVKSRICIARIGAAHGVRGEVRVKLFSDDPVSLTRYGVLSDSDGLRRFRVLSARASKNVFICRIENVKNRNDAESLNGVCLYVDRSQLPDPGEEEFYHSDLLGLEARLETGQILGKIVAIPDFGAGDLLDIVPAHGKGFYIPFTKGAVPEIDLENGFVTIVPPAGLLDEADDNEQAMEGEGFDFSESPELLDGLKKS